MFYHLIYHGWVRALGRVIREDSYTYEITGVDLFTDVTHGESGLSVPFGLLVGESEYIYGGYWNEPLIAVQNLDGCTAPYPSPRVCYHAKFPPGDPYDTHDDDIASYGLNTLGETPDCPQAACHRTVLLAHGALRMDAHADPFDEVSDVSNTQVTWQHRVVQSPGCEIGCQ